MVHPAVTVCESGNHLVRRYQYSRFELVGVGESGIKVIVSWKKPVRLRHQKHNAQAKHASSDIASGVDAVVEGGVVEALILDALDVVVVKDWVESGSLEGVCVGGMDDLLDAHVHNLFVLNGSIPDRD